MLLVDMSAWIEWLIDSPAGRIVAVDLPSQDQWPRKLATADAVIYATALANGAELLTCDGHFQGLSFVRFVPKSEGQ
jgi:predicted nucleic acid-binding protein